MEQLARTAGAEVVGVLTQRLDRPNPAFFIGRGKLQELIRLRNATDADLVIFDDDLSPIQHRNLERALGVKVIDRTMLILDVFAQRARTREGKLQVELAQHEYLLPRLVGLWSHLHEEQQRGGIGMRGPGESQLELDRRLIKRRIEHLKKELEEVRRHRELHRKQRRKNPIPIVSIVGYTNAGKSTLFNALSGADVLVEDKLFATLDPTTRRVQLPDGRDILITDTVGFIQKLPPMVVEAFKATLEELEEADLLLHVVDITHPNAAEQSQAVDAVLESLGLGEKPKLLVLNKVDLLVPGDWDGGKFDEDISDFPLFISAAKGWGLRRLLRAIARALSEEMVPISVYIPYEEMELLDLFRRRGIIVHREYDAKGMFIEGKIPSSLYGVFKSFIAPFPGDHEGEGEEELVEKFELSSSYSGDPEEEREEED